jgi:hypothetical protein
MGGARTVPKLDISFQIGGSKTPNYVGRRGLGINDMTIFDMLGLLVTML